MPTYEYECTKGHRFEAQQRISEDPLKTCRVCRSKVRRLISATNFVLKGSGWYSDGYSSGKPASSGSNGSGASESNASGSSDKGSSKQDSSGSSSSDSGSKSSDSSSSSTSTSSDSS